MDESQHRRSPTVEAAPDADTAGDLSVDVGILVANSPQGDPDALYSFARQMVEDTTSELQSVTDVAWRVHAEETHPLPDRRARRPSEFLDEAALRMVEGPYDMIVVLTDTPLLSRRRKIVSGLASPVSRIVVVSTHKLLISPRDKPVRAIDSEPVRWNGAALLLHLFGHVLGARHGAANGVMEPFEFDPDRQSVPDFDAEMGSRLHRVANQIPEEDATPRGRVRRLAFHVRSATRHPAQILWALVHSRAPLLSFSLPKLATAALTPTLILVFSAETWDVGLHMTDAVAAMFAAGSVLAAAVHLMSVQNLSFPRKRSQLITEHVALVNVTIFLILVLAMVGLFALVGSIILVIELFVFPSDLMANWPTLEEPAVGIADLVRTAAFISTIGVLSGALAGGIENRAVLRQIALFLDRP